MIPDLSLLEAHECGERQRIDEAHHRDPGAARALFRALKARAVARELDGALGRFHTGAQRAKLSVRPIENALRVLSGLGELLFPEAVPVRDGPTAPLEHSERAYYGPFELRFAGPGRLALGIPPAATALSIFKEGRPYAMLEGRESRSIELGQGSYLLRLGLETWELTVED